MSDRPLSPDEAALWDRVLATVRPLRVAPKPVAKVAVAKVSPGKVAVAVEAPRAMPSSAPLPGKGGAGGGSSAVDLFEKLLKLGVGGGDSPKRASAARPHPNPASGEQRPALFRPSRGDGRPDAPKGEGLKRARANTLDGSWDKKLSRGLVLPDCSIDLHGHNLSTAYATLDGALEQSIRMGDRVILLVTGKPPRAESERPHAPHSSYRGAIRAAIGDWLAGSRHASAIAAVRDAHPRHGGAGALYIVLRRNDPNRIY